MAASLAELRSRRSAADDRRTPLPRRSSSGSPTVLDRAGRRRPRPGRALERLDALRGPIGPGRPRAADRRGDRPGDRRRRGPLPRTDEGGRPAIFGGQVLREARRPRCERRPAGPIAGDGDRRRTPSGHRPRTVDRVDGRQRTDEFLVGLGGGARRLPIPVDQDRAWRCRSCCRCRSGSRRPGRRRSRAAPRRRRSRGSRRRARRSTTSGSSGSGSG